MARPSTPSGPPSYSGELPGYAEASNDAYGAGMPNNQSSMRLLATTANSESHNSYDAAFHSASYPPSSRLGGHRTHQARVARAAPVTAHSSAPPGRPHVRFANPPQPREHTSRAALETQDLPGAFSDCSPRRALHNRSQSILDTAPTIPPPSPSIAYAPRASTQGAPTVVSWSPSRRGSDASRRPPSPVHYEPADINGSPRPGTPSSKYTSSSRRPLPPAPLFSGSAVSGNDSASAITGVDGEDDVFAPVNAPVKPREHLHSSHSFQSESTFTDDLYPKDDEHYGPAPLGRHSRRGTRHAQMAKKEVRLINGELILECKIPTKLHSFLPRRDELEVTHMRYTAVTCDPDDFVLSGYKLRQNIGSTTRETELFICITMYNENEIDFTRTMHGVMRNIAHFCSRTKSRTWGKDGWKKAVVCIISDGRRKVNPRTLDVLAAMGVYQHGIAKNFVNQREVTAHVYEYTTQVSLDPDLKFKGAEKGIVPCQMIFCLKEKNQKKLNSHRWFFNAFGKALQPNVCILLDVGTKPGPTSLYHLWKAFDTDSNVAGACGEIKAGKGKGWLGLFNPLVASQNFEYKMSNILDKPLESVFGYITVLPGALSAYRYYALQNDTTGHGPLSQYFKGECLHGQNSDVFTANMYLAEDRILCWELVAKRDDRWLLKYVKSATGETDVPGMVQWYLHLSSRLIGHRRGARVCFTATKMAERSFLCCGLLSRSFQANLEDRPLRCAESLAAHRIRLPVRELTVHVVLSCEWWN